MNKKIYYIKTPKVSTFDWRQFYFEQLNSKLKECAIMWQRYDCKLAEMWQVWHTAKILKSCSIVRIVQHDYDRDRRSFLYGDGDRRR